MAESKGLNNVHLLTKDFHVWPDLHGNRSPLADSTIKGMISGLKMSSTIDDLAVIYLGFVQALSVSRATKKESLSTKWNPFVRSYSIYI